MVINDESAQLFTIEGLIAGLIMLSTAFIVMGSVNVYTPGDAHIPDMQLKQLGSDALLMMDIPDRSNNESTLKELVEKAISGSIPEANAAKSNFRTIFENELKKGTGTSFIIDSIRYNATVYYRDIGTDSILSSPLGDTGAEIARKPAISTGRLVMVESGGQGRICRVEVRLWRE